MTNEQIQIEIAKLMGCFDGESMEEGTLPNYLTSLDACRSFEDSLNAEQQMEYAGIVHELVHSPRHWKHINFDLIHASSFQRCEAFLRLHGKWVES